MKQIRDGGKQMKEKEIKEGMKETWKKEVFHALLLFLDMCFIQKDPKKVKEMICEDVSITGTSWEGKIYNREEFLKLFTTKKTDFYYIEKYEVEDFICICKQEDFYECYGTITIYKKQKNDENSHYQMSYATSFRQVDGEMKLSTLFLSKPYLTLDFFVRMYEERIIGTLDNGPKTTQAIFLNLLNDALRDSLTGAYNRGTGERSIKKALEEELSYVFLLMDIDGFKEVNDNHGHQEGDQILKYTVELLKGAFRTTDIIYRLGGDEFVVFASPCENLDAIKRKLDGINEEYQEEIRKRYGKCESSLSFGGVCSNTVNERRFDEIYRVADEMLYGVKERGGRGYSIEEKL